jgi:phi13 family phage major tail protein
VKIGLKFFKYSKITVATDASGNETETYGTVKTASKAMTASVSVNRANTKGYADDNVAESDPAFLDGTLTIEGDDLQNDVIADLCGATLGTGQDQDLSFKDDNNPPYIRFGFIVPMVKSGERVWIGLIFTRVKFGSPEDNYATKGQSIEFRGWSLTGDISKNAAGIWKIQSARKTTESAAVTWLDANLAPSGT